jgi:hypothetical protein
MLARIVWGESMKEVLAWLHDSDNRAILTLIGGVIWTVFLYFFPPRPPESKSDRQATTNGTASDASTKRFRAAYPFMIWVIGAVVLVAVWLSWRALTAETPTTTVQYKLCLGEYERNCGFEHDVYLYCYTDVDAWAKGQCIRHTASAIGSHDGNKCGYTNVSVVCVKEVPK